MRQKEVMCNAQRSTFIHGARSCLQSSGEVNVAMKETCCGTNFYVTLDEEDILMC